MTKKIDFCVTLGYKEFMAKIYQVIINDFVTSFCLSNSWKELKNRTQIEYIKRVHFAFKKQGIEASQEEIVKQIVKSETKS